MLFMVLLYSIFPNLTSSLLYETWPLGGKIFRIALQVAQTLFQDDDYRCCRALFVGANRKFEQLIRL